MSLCLVNYATISFTDGQIKEKFGQIKSSKDLYLKSKVVVVSSIPL